MSITKTVTCVLFIFLASIANAITVVGPLVDKYCWNTLGGTALDTGANLKQDPFQHTIHCLLYSLCLPTGFMIVEKKAGASEYTVKYELDANGNSLTAAYLRSIAPSGSARYSARTGFKISATGTVSGNVLQVTHVTEHLPTTTPSTSAPSATPVTSPPTFSRAPSMTPTTMAPTMNTTASGNTQTSLVNLQFGIAVKASSNSTHAILDVHGSNSTWFAVGFGTQMVNSQAIVFEMGAPIKRYLLGAKSKDQFQEQTPIGFTVLSDVTTSSTRKVSLLFPLPAPTGIDFGRSTAVSIIYASGSTPTLSYHGTSRNKTTMTVGVLPEGVRPTSGAEKSKIVGVFFLVAFACWF